MITQARLKELFHYCPLTGVFTTLVPTQRRAVGSRLTMKDNGYIKVVIDGVLQKAHRLAFLYMTGSMPSGQVDHINGVRDDNSWANLREATPADNARNAGIRKDNRSGVAGVSWHSLRGMWQVRIHNGGKAVALGYFTDLEEAKAARRSALDQYGYHPNHGRAA